MVREAGRGHQLSGGLVSCVRGGSSLGRCGLERLSLRT